MLKVTNDGFRKLGQGIVGPVTKQRGQLYTKLAAGGHRIILRNFRAGGKPAWPVSKAAAEQGRPTLVEHGNLFRSITRRGTANAAIVESTDFRAAIHHFGGVIVPKTKKYLTIPIAPEAMGKRTSDFPEDETWFHRNDEGKLFFMWGNIALFILLKSVTQKSRPFMDISSPDDITELTEIVRDHELGMNLRIQ